MGWFKKLTSKIFRRGAESDYDGAWEWEDGESERYIDYNDKEQRDDYVKNCLERMADAIDLPDEVAEALSGVVRNCDVGVFNDELLRRKRTGLPN